ncbi:MAG TPA: hypothetical protein VGG46_13825 [Terriglobales bacterium]|jgi:hypothetical protein
MREHPVEKGLVTGIVWGAAFFGILVAVVFAYPYVKARIPSTRQVSIFMNGDWRVGETRKCSSQDTVSLDCSAGGVQGDAQENSQTYRVRFNKRLAPESYGTTYWDCIRKESGIVCELGNRR